MVTKIYTKQELYIYRTRDGIITYMINTCKLGWYSPILNNYRGSWMADNRQWNQRKARGEYIKELNKW